MPTPNGGLHLGHISGPYLKMDVMARAQQRNGSHASIIFGSDVYESYTTLKAWVTGKSIKDVCNHYHNQIVKDLNALKINYDAYINPLDEEYNDRFNSFLSGVVKDLINKKVTEIRPENYLYSHEQDCYLAGCWIEGLCPVCGAGTGSYQCEECGTHYRPMDIVSPSFRRGNYELTEIADYALYLKINKLEEHLSHLNQMGFRKEFLDITKLYFDRQGRYIRITNPDKWGTPWHIEGSKLPHVLFTYTGLYFFSLFCGELYAEKYHLPHNAFHPKSDIITVASFGIDCSVPYMVAAVGCGLESGTYKPMDFLLPNYFFMLENAKFSTSRGHAIWGNDIINKTPATADSVRYFLTLNNPEDQMCNFSVNAFIEFVNTNLAVELQSLLIKVWLLTDATNAYNIPDVLIEKLEHLLITQERYLRPPHFKFKDSCEPLQDWIRLSGELSLDASVAYWWLKGFSLLAYPIMPDCARSLWNLLGHVGDPVEKDFFLSTTVKRDQELPCFFLSINFEELRPALPATLFIKNE